MKKVLVTGVNGQLGSELKNLFSMESEYEVSYLSRVDLPLEHTEDIQTKLTEYNPEIIIHAAAYTAVDKAESEKDLASKINHLASGEIARYCKNTNCRLVAISTDYVFDGNSNKPLNESAAVDPINTYGLSKLLGENAIFDILKDAIVIRTSWVYSVYGNNFVKTMIRLMQEREEISVINDQIGSPTYAKDLADAIIKIIKHESWSSGIYHYSNEGEVSWYDFAKEIKAIKDIDCKINAISTSDYPTAAKRPKYSLLDKSKIVAIYGIAIPHWKESLRLMINSL